MLPQNTELRRAHAPLSEFVKGAFTTPLLYKPRTDFSYQSMGTLLAGEIVERVSGQKLRDFQKKEIFDVLGMKDSSLGMGGRRIADTVLCQTGTGPDVVRFGPNSEYWRDMGHPWGGMHSTVTDLAVLLQTFLNGGTYNGKRLLSPTTVARMTSDQNGALQKPWGLGWGLATSPVWVYLRRPGFPSCVRAFRCDRDCGLGGSGEPVGDGDPDNAGLGGRRRPAVANRVERGSRVGG